MGKRELRALEREQAKRDAARQAVFNALQADAKYQALWARKDRAGAAWNHADAYGKPETERLLAAFRRACKRCERYESAALERAGLTPY